MAKLTDKLKVGDWVILPVTSRFNDGRVDNPIGVRGQVYTIAVHNPSDPTELNIKVLWNNGLSNWYLKEDLRRV
jgi:hypothetical protein